MNDVIIVPTTTVKNVLFVNSAVLSLSDYINSDTIEIGYDTHVSTIIPSAKNHNNVTRIGFAFHYSGEDDDHEAFFTDSDLGESVENLFADSDLGESVETFSPNVQSMLDLLLGGGITHVDFLACGTLKSEKWRLFYQLLRLKTGVVIGASDDNTGNMKLGGDWIMESTHEEVGQIYFTSEIVNWASLLALPTGLNQYYHTFYTINATTPAVITRTIYDNSGTMQDTQDISFGGMPIKDVLSLIDGGGGTNPYAIGIVDSSLNKICMDIAFCGVYTKPLTDRQKTKLMTYVNTTFKEPHAYMTAIYTVTVNNGAFVFKNSLDVVVQTPISLTSGLVYLFDQSDSTNSENILRLSSTSPSLTEITSGVTKNGTPGTLNAYTIISPTSNLSVYGYFPPQVTYTVTVDSGVYWISTNGATAVQKPHLIFESGTTYIFNQSHASNVGYPLQLTLHAGFPTTLSAYNYTSAPYTTGVVTTGTSFKISVDASTPQPLYYYCTNPGALMGYIPPLALIKYTFDISNGTVVANSGTATDGNGTLKYRAGTDVTNATGTTYSYNTSIFKRGSSSLFNNVYSSASSYVQVKNMSLNSTEMTFCFWIRFTELSTGISCIPLSFENTTSGTNVRRLDIMSMVHLQAGYNNTFLNFTNTEVAHFFNTTGTNTKSFFEDTWRHLAITINTSTTRVKMYTDGVLRHTFITNLITFPTTTGGFRILMGTPDGTGDFSSFKGHVDDYRIYNTTLTDAEILSIYHNTNYNF